MSHIEVLKKHWKELRAYPNVLNTNYGKKIVNGVQTDTDAIIVYVSKKHPEEKLDARAVIPKTIEGIPTDVVELSTPDYVLGDTSVSHKPPHIQRRLGGGVVRK